MVNSAPFPPKRWTINHMARQVSGPCGALKGFPLGHGQVAAGRPVPTLWGGGLAAGGAPASSEGRRWFPTPGDATCGLSSGSTAALPSSASWRSVLQLEVMTDKKNYSHGARFLSNEKSEKLLPSLPKGLVKPAGILLPKPRHCSLEFQIGYECA